MTHNLTDGQREAAAQWWMQAARNQKFDNLGETRGKDPEETRTSTFASVMASVLADKDMYTEEQLALFGERIKSLLVDHEKVYGYPVHSLYVDYGPTGLLYDACQESGLKGTRLPWKTVMWFEGGGVQVACGYGASPLEILRKEATT